MSPLLFGALRHTIVTVRAGRVAGSVVLAFLWAAHRIEPSIAFPPLLVAERIIRFTPGDVATYFIEALGPNATRLLTAISVGAAILLAARSSPRSLRWKVARMPDGRGFRGLLDRFDRVPRPPETVARRRGHRVAHGRRPLLGGPGLGSSSGARDRPTRLGVRR